MLILVQKGEKQRGFFLKQRAKRGKLPPMIQGIRVGEFPCVLLGVYGEISPCNQYLTPYFLRGDVIIGSFELKGWQGNEGHLDELVRRQCVNAAKKWVQEKSKTFQTVLYDPTATCVGVAAEFCALGKPLWVVTSRCEEYVPCAEYTLLSYGNPPGIRSELPRKAELVVAPYGISSPIPFKATVVAPGHTWAKREDLAIPQSILQTVPKGFDPLEVAAGCMEVFGAGMEGVARLSLGEGTDKKKTGSP